MPLALVLLKMGSDVLEASETAGGLKTSLLRWVEQGGRDSDRVDDDSLASLEDEGELLLVELAVAAAKLDLGEEDSEGEVIRVKEGSRRSLEDVKEQVANEDGESLTRVGDVLERRIVKEDKVEDVEEEAKGELVEVVEEVQLVEDEEDGAAGLSEWEVLARDLIDLGHDHVRLLDLASDLCCLSLECLQRLDDPARWGERHQQSSSKD